MNPSARKIAKETMALKSKGNRSVILFYPRVQPKKHHHELPLSVLALIPPLRKKGYSVVLIDERTDRHALSTLERSLDKAVCVGISSMTGYQIQGGIAAAEVVRKKRGIPIVWGGWHVSLLPEESASSPYVDIVVRGQGEVTFAELVQAIEDKDDLYTIPGITFKNGREVVNTADRPIISLEDLDPMPYDCIDINKFHPHFSYLSSIGCPMSCGFCADAVVYKGRWRAMNPYRLADEITALSQRLSRRIKSIYFIDNNFFVNQERVATFCQEILKRKTRIVWEALGHPKQLARFDNEFYGLIRRAGCYRILTGTESGSQEVLDYINKKTTLEDTITFAKKCGQHQIIPVISLMCGFPQRPLDDLKETVLYVNEVKRVNNKVKTKLFFFTPYPGSRLYQDAIKSGFQPPKNLKDWSRYTLNVRNMPYIDPVYEELSFWIIDKYFPKITGNKEIHWEEVLQKFEKSRGLAFYKRKTHRGGKGAS